MPERLSSAERKDSHELIRTTRKDKPALVLSLEFWLQSLLAWFLQLLLHTFFDLQDAFLAIGFVRRLVAFALAPRCQVAVLAHLKSPARNKCETSLRNLQVSWLCPLLTTVSAHDSGRAFRSCNIM